MDLAGFELWKCARILSDVITEHLWGQDLIHLLLMVGELSNWREGSMLQKWLIDSCVYQRELGGHLSCPRHRALQVSLNEGHACSQGQNRVQVVPCALNIRIMLSWQRLVFSISLWDRWNTKERTIWTSSWIRKKLMYYHILPFEARNNNVPECGLGLWLLHWFYLQVLSFWVIVPSEVYFCCNFPSISWKLAFWCTEQHHNTKLVANSSRAEGIVYFFCCGCSHDLFSHLKDYSLGKSGTHSNVRNKTEGNVVHPEWRSVFIPACLHTSISA